MKLFINMKSKNQAMCWTLKSNQKKKTDLVGAPCLSPAACVRALDVTVSQSSIQVARGQPAVLPCSFSTSAALNNLNIIWMVIPLSNANQPEQVGAAPPTAASTAAGDQAPSPSASQLLLGVSGPSAVAKSHIRSTTIQTRGSCLVNKDIK